MNIQKTAPTPKLVTMIPADPQMTERDLRKKHLRVAPYCRVSTDKEEQLSSYEAQIEYYTEKIDAIRIGQWSASMRMRHHRHLGQKAQRFPPNDPGL